VSGLTNRSTYTCWVFDWNASGTSRLSAQSNRVVPSTNATIPAAPTSPSALPGNGHATIRWTVPPNAWGVSIWDYVITPYLGTHALTPHVDDTSASDDVVRGLTNGKTDRFTVAAHNAYGTSASSVFTNAVTVGTPSAPTIITATTDAEGSLNVAFSTPANNGAPITHYTTTCTSTNGGVPNTTTGRTSPITVSGLTPAKTYTCTATATNSRGPGPPSTASMAFKA